MSNIDLLSNAIKQIYETRGVEGFSNSRLFHALLDDFVPTLTNERRILRMAIDDSILKQLSFVFKGDESDKQYEAIRIKKVIEDNNGLSEKWSLFIVESFMYASGSNLNLNFEKTEIVNESNVIVMSNGCKYEGEVVNGKPHGKGKCIWPNEKIYEGDYINGNRTGKGTTIFPDGGKYVGDFLDNLMDGKGVMTFPDGRIYSGEFRKGKFQGYGNLSWPNGEIYEGYFDDSKRNGNGKYIWSNGDVYEGEFVNGKITGKGTMTKNGVKSSGYFENGVIKSPDVSSHALINTKESEKIKQKKILLEKKESLTKELKSLGIFEVKKKAEIRNQISEIDLKLTLNRAEKKLSYLEDIEKGTSQKKHIMKVDDKFSIKGRGTVVVGKLLCDKLHTGDNVIVNDKTYLVSAIEMNKKILQFAEFGDYISILVRGLDSRDTDKGDYIYKEMK